MQKKYLRKNLREAYNKYAQERDTSVLEAWKIEERSNFLALLLREKRRSLLEIGAGTGRDSKFFLDNGLDPVCIDLSPAMVALCRQKGLTAQVMDISEASFADESFEAVYAFNSLLHLAKAEFPASLRRIERLLKTAGVAFVGVYGGYDFEGVWEQDTYVPKRFFSFFTDEDLLREVTQVFDIISFRCIPTGGQDDRLHFQSLTLRKRPPSQAALPS